MVHLPSCPQASIINQRIIFPFSLMPRGANEIHQAKKKQSDRAEKFDRIETRKHLDLESITRHNQIRESLSTSAQFNCEGCG